MESVTGMLCLAHTGLLENPAPTFKNQEVSHKHLNIQKGQMIQWLGNARPRSSVAAVGAWWAVLALATPGPTRWTSDTAIRCRILGKCQFPLLT